MQLVAYRTRPCPAQARVADKATVVSTSTRNFPNRLGDGADVYLASAELAAVAAIKGELPSKEEYLSVMKEVDTTAWIKVAGWR